MIAPKLKYYRAIYRLTQRDVAEACGVAPSVIGQIESRNKDVTLSVAVKIAAALEVSVDALVGELSEDERDQVRICNRRVMEARESKRAAQRKAQKRRYNERVKNGLKPP